MNALELIKSRRSVRTFDGNSLKKEDAEKILEYAENVDNPYHLPITWRILDAKSDGLTSAVISGTDSFIAGKMAREQHAEEAFGFSFEKIVLFAQYLGIGTTWIAGTMDRPAFERAMDLSQDEVMPCISPLGYPAAKMSLREFMMRKGIRADKRVDFDSLFFDGSFDKPLTPEQAGSLADPLEMVRWAPSAVNKQPWRVVREDSKIHFYEKKSRGYINAGGWDIQKIDIGIALCHFDCGLSEQQIQAELLVDDPNIPVPADTQYIASYILK